jgi:hypothetical protein
MNSAHNVMLPGCSWLICWFTHPASVAASWAWVITLLRVTRGPEPRSAADMYRKVSEKDLNTDSG